MHRAVGCKPRTGSRAPTSISQSSNRHWRGILGPQPRRQGLKPADCQFQPVAPQERTDAGRGAGQDHIAGEKCEELLQLGDELRHVPHHRVQVSRLMEHALDGERDPASGGIARSPRRCPLDRSERIVRRPCRSHRALLASSESTECRGRSCRARCPPRSRCSPISDRPPVPLRGARLRIRRIEKGTARVEIVRVMLKESESSRSGSSSTSMACSAWFPPMKGARRTSAGACDPTIGSVARTGRGKRRCWSYPEWGARHNLKNW